jgi:hypothetical protein
LREGIVNVGEGTLLKRSRTTIGKGKPQQAVAIRKAKAKTAVHPYLAKKAKNHWGWWIEDAIG